MVVDESTNRSCQARRDEAAQNDINLFYYMSSLIVAGDNGINRADSRWILFCSPYFFTYFVLFTDVCLVSWLVDNRFIYRLDFTSCVFVIAFSINSAFFSSSSTTMTTTLSSVINVSLSQPCLFILVTLVKLFRCPGTAFQCTYYCISAHALRKVQLYSPYWFFYINILIIFQ